MITYGPYIPSSRIKMPDPIEKFYFKKYMLHNIIVSLLWFARNLKVSVHIICWIF